MKFGKSLLPSSISLTDWGTFPFEPIAQALAGLGDFVPESPAFDKLYETLSDALAERQKEGTAAKLNSDRGYQKLNKGLHYDAIRWSGRAVGLLVKAEYEEELVEALRGCSIAYMEAGLFWAARNYALAAVTSEFRKFKQSGSVDDVDPSILSHWFECELQLGRVPFALAAYELGAMVRNARSRTQEQKDFADRHRIEQGNRLAAVMVGTQFDDLQKLKAFPAALDRLGLGQASTTLMFLMGGEEALREDAGVPEDETSEGIESLFNHMSAAATAAGFPKPDYLLDHKVVLQSRVLGCEIAATCENSLTSIGISEAILGALESLLATSLGLDTLPHLDRLRLRLQSKDDAPITPSLDFIEESGSTVAIITHRPKLVYASREEAEGFFHWLSDAVIKIFLTFAVPAEPDTWGKTVLAGETGFSRAITFSNVPTMYEVVFGDNAKLGIEHWSETGDPETAIKRASPWLPKVVEGKHATKAVTPGVGESPEGMFDPEKKKHSDYRIVSPIDARKWGFSDLARCVFHVRTRFRK